MTCALILSMPDGQKPRHAYVSRMYVTTASSLRPIDSRGRIGAEATQAMVGRKGKRLLACPTILLGRIGSVPAPRMLKILNASSGYRAKRARLYSVSQRTPACRGPIRDQDADA